MERQWKEKEGKRGKKDWEKREYIHIYIHTYIHTYNNSYSAQSYIKTDRPRITNVNELKAVLIRWVFRPTLVAQWANTLSHSAAGLAGYLSGVGSTPAAAGMSSQISVCML